jgi:hypothetical protein
MSLQNQSPDLTFLYRQAVIASADQLRTMCGDEAALQALRDSVRDFGSGSFGEAVFWYLAEHRRQRATLSPVEAQS